jgi:hypothetical protein
MPIHQHAGKNWVHKALKIAIIGNYTDSCTKYMDSTLLAASQSALNHLSIN